jgi:hypothetical protein
MPRSDDFGAAAHELRESWIAGLLGSAAGVMAIAARHSRIVTTAGGVVRGVRGLPAVERLRVVALAIAVAAAAHVVLETLVPPHCASTVPPLLWVAVGIVSASIAAAAGSPRRSG